MTNFKIADKLRELRGERTQQEAADGIGINRNAYAMYERGERVPRDDVKILIANYYNMTVSDIFFEGK
jgi:DNA-binding XRE family transcriptional regulator